MDERDRRVTELCEEAVTRLAERLPEAEIGALLRFGDVLRHVAHAGQLRLIYEVRRDQGGVVWRAAASRETQLVADVRTDPDYLASDERIRSEIAAPILVSGEVVGVLDVEFQARAFTPGEADAVTAAAERLGRSLATAASRD